MVKVMPWGTDIVKLDITIIFSNKIATWENKKSANVIFKPILAPRELQIKWLDGTRRKNIFCSCLSGSKGSSNRHFDKEKSNGSYLLHSFSIFHTFWSSWVSLKDANLRKLVTFTWNEAFVNKYSWSTQVLAPPLNQWQSSLGTWRMKQTFSSLHSSKNSVNTETATIEEKGFF